jgi:hypothetical protein
MHDFEHNTTAAALLELLRQLNAAGGYKDFGSAAKRSLKQHCAPQRS